jgi:hypothetical protein
MTNTERAAQRLAGFAKPTTNGKTGRPLNRDRNFLEWTYAYAYPIRVASPQLPISPYSDNWNFCAVFGLAPARETLFLQHS